MLTGVKDDSGPETVAEPVRQMAQAAEVLATDGFGCAPPEQAKSSLKCACFTGAGYLFGGCGIPLAGSTGEGIQQPHPR